MMRRAGPQQRNATPVAALRRPFYSLFTIHYLLSSRGQTALEYAALIAIVSAALVGMSLYTRRALSGRWKTVGDAFGFGRQYERCVTKVNGSLEPGC